jgi:hypothetical protein
MRAGLEAEVARMLLAEADALCIGTVFKEFIAGFPGMVA